MKRSVAAAALPEDRAFWMLIQDLRDQAHVLAETNRQVSVAVIELRAALEGLHGRMAALEEQRRPCPDLVALVEALSDEREEQQRQAERREDWRWALWVRLLGQGVVWGASAAAGAVGALWAAGK